MACPAGIEILVLDVDGVLTDGRIYVSSEGQESKAFFIQDGAGIKFLLLAGIKVAVLSGHDSEAVTHRCRRLGVTEVAVGVKDKLPVFLDMLARNGCRPEQAAVMGDDVMDLPLFRHAGFRVAVPEAHPEVLQAADHVTRAPGGQGAVREVADLLLKARGLYHKMMEDFRP